MDNTFISESNIDNIYGYINAEMVKNHNINLDDDNKNKKIIKKLTKTVFDTLNNNLDTRNSVGLNNFNDMVQKKCVPFLLKKLSDKNTSNRVAKPKKKRYSVKKQFGVNNMNIEPTFKMKNSENSGDSFQKYINDADQFEELVKVSNKKINDSFKAYSDKESVFNSHDNINDSCNSISSDFNIDRCSIKDDIKSNKLNSSAFNPLFSNKLVNKNYNNSEINNNNNNNIDNKNELNNNIKNSNNSNSNKSNELASAYDNYDNNLNVRDLLSKVLVNQQDHSSNEIESYEGELYLPNLIREVGEEAPIQPLLFQNTSQGTERIGIKHLIIDSGNTAANNPLNFLNFTSTGPDGQNNFTVTNIGRNPWYKLKIDLQNKLKIEKLSDIFVRSFSIFGATTNDNCLYFTVNIEELNISKPSNNKFLRDKIIFRNTRNVGDVSTIVTYNYPSKSYYVSTVNPKNFVDLTIELTNDSGRHVDTNGAGNNSTFATANLATNRFVIELEIIPRTKPNEMIFDRTSYGNALNSQL